MTRLLHVSALVLALVCSTLVAPASGQRAREVRPNFEQAERFSPSYLRQRTYSTSVSPKWIGKSDRFWYSFRNREGTRYVLVDLEARTTKPLFDHEDIAARLSAAVRKPQESHALALEKAEVDDEGGTLSFVLEKKRFEIELATGELKTLGDVEEKKEDSQQAERSRRNQRSRGGRGEPREEEKKDPRAHRNFAPDRTAYVFQREHDLYYVEASDEVKEKIRVIEERLKKEAEEKKAAEEKGEKLEEEQEEEKQEEKKEGEGEKDAKDGKDEKEKEDKVDERERWADDVDESKALRLSEDGEEGFSFSRTRRGSGGRSSFADEDSYLEALQAGEAFEPIDFEDEESEEEDTRARPRVEWAPDSSAFYAVRRDSRKVEQLFLVNSLSKPRPTLQSYDYPLPGEEHIGRSELFVFDRKAKVLRHVPAKWKDESYQNLHWRSHLVPLKSLEDEDFEPEVEGTGDVLRVLRRDRLMRNLELCSLDTRTGECKVLLEEGFEDANLDPRRVRYLRSQDAMIWWSERSGWGHFYLYGRDGTFRNAITKGAFLATEIVDVDEKKGILYFYGNGREGDENVYFRHLYRVFLDGTGLTLLNPGDANHRSTLSPTRNYVLDNCSRIDMAPCSRVYDSSGMLVMELEEADLSRLREAGWRMPETFRFKAADGITELYGNLWKPFDFDPKKKYPIIAEIYPGPQTEGVSHSFSASNSRQELAQIGFIVVQLGHRGGTPGRSKAYHSYGYYNLRDYGLADKKAGIEQLAERFEWIDIDRVGLYGHSGGGFMTAAAMMKEPYNDFFKVGVSSSGNHDNNVYGRHWAERYHGLRQKEIAKKKESKGASKDGEKADEKTGEKTGEKSGDSKVKSASFQEQDEKKDGKQEGEKKGEDEKGEGKKGEEEEVEKELRFEIEVPTNAELAANLKGRLLLVHGDMDNNVHPAGTMRLVDALIKANKRFDMLIIPGKRHGYGDASDYFKHRKWEFFAEHLLGYHHSNADIREK